MKKRIFICFLLSQILFLVSLFSILDFKCVSAAENNIYTDNLIPKMTSNTTPRGQVIASYNGSWYGSSAYCPWNAFDYDPYDHSGDSSYWLYTSPAGWIGYIFDNPTAICKYKIQSVLTVPERCPKDFIFQASNDGINWVNLDERHNLGWANGETKTFIFKNSTKYKEYRINVQSVVSGSWISIDQIEMMGLKQSVNLEENNISMHRNTKKKLGVTTEGITSKIIWSSSDDSIASVDSEGNITARNEGQAVITAKAEGIEVSDSCTVTVKPALILDIECDRNSVNLNQIVNAELYLENTKGINSITLNVKYDNTKFKFLGSENTGNVRLLKQKDSNGEIQLVISKAGQDLEVKNKLLNLKFKAIGQGSSVIEIINAEASNKGISKIYKLTGDECGQAETIIK